MDIFPQARTTRYYSRIYLMEIYEFLFEKKLIITNQNFSTEIMF